VEVSTKLVRPLIVASVLLGACAQANDIATPSPAAAKDCRVTGQTSWTDAVPGAPVGAALPPGFALIPGGSYTIEGDCVRRIRAIGPRKLRLNDRAVEVNSDGSMTFGEPYGFEYVRTVPVGPPIGRSPILAVDTVSGSGFVGVWKVDREWVVASFSETSKPQPLLRSKVPIISVGYLPHPDTKSGVLYLMQQLGPKKGRLLAYTWRHPGF
jgi:hypothetical protein